MTIETLETEPGFEECRPTTGWKAQFSHPSGRLGALVGHLMALKNAPINRLAVERLDVQPDDRILEIGFGPGTAIERIAERLETGTVSGIDPSKEMLRQARRRNRKYEEKGRVSLLLGTAGEIPWPGASFDKVLAVNVVHHWPDLDQALSEILRVLEPGGILLLPMRMAAEKRSIFPQAPGSSDQQIRQLVGHLESSGFGRIECEAFDVGRRVTFIWAQVGSGDNSSA